MSVSYGLLRKLAMTSDIYRHFYLFDAIIGVY